MKVGKSSWFPQVSKIPTPVLTDRFFYLLFTHGVSRCSLTLTLLIKCVFILKQKSGSWSRVQFRFVEVETHNHPLVLKYWTQPGAQRFTRYLLGLIPGQEMDKTGIDRSKSLESVYCSRWSKLFPKFLQTDHGSGAHVRSYDRRLGAHA